MTKQQRQIIEKYKKSTAYSLNDIYKNYSTYKAIAENDILEEMQSCRGWGYKILGFNCDTFSCAYLKHNEINGNDEIVYHTATNKRVFDYVI